MLKQLKTFYVENIPSYEDYCKARDIARDENCVVELRWCPNTFAGWWHEYVFENSNPVELDAKTPKVYAI